LDWLQLGLVLVALLYTSLLALAVLAAQFVGLVGVRFFRPTGQAAEREPGGARWRNPAIYAGIACVAVALFVPWLRYGWIRTAGAGILYPGFLLRLLKELGDNSYAMTGLILAGVVAGIRAMRRHNTRTPLIWMVSWFSVVTLAVLVLKLAMRHPFAIADILAATPPLMFLAGYGLSHVGERLTILPEMPYQLSAPAFVYAALMILGSAWIAQSHWKREPVDWAGAAALLQGTAREGDAVAMPKIYHLIEYYAPNLGAFRSSEIDPGPGSLSTGASQRRVVVCYNNLTPDPCSGFRQEAQDDKAWRKLPLRGFTVFIRQEK
jgi:hypothetical protein